MELSAAMKMVQKSVDESAKIIFRSRTDENFTLDFIRITIVATGLKKGPMMAANNVY